MMNSIVNRNTEFDNTLVPGEVDIHEVANVQILPCGDVLEVRVNTASGFVNRPAIQLQKENGDILKPNIDGTLQSDGSFVVCFQMSNEVVQEGLIDIRGTNSQGGPVSAVESFTVTRFQEEGEYQIFGPHGAVSLEGVKMKGDPPLVVSIGPAPTDIFEDLENLSALSPAFLISSDSEKPFHGPLQLMFSITGAPKKVFSDETCTPKAGIYYWQERGRDWKKVSGNSIINPTARIIETSILKSGIYAAFIEKDVESEKNIESIPYQALLEKAVQQQDEIDYLRLQVDARNEKRLHLNRMRSTPEFLDDNEDQKPYSW